MKTGADARYRVEENYATGQFCETAAVVYDFSPIRPGGHACNFLQGWRGKLVCVDFGGYKPSFELGVTEIGCMAQSSNSRPQFAFFLYCGKIYE